MIGDLYNTPNHETDRGLCNSRAEGKRKAGGYFITEKAVEY